MISSKRMLIIFFFLGIYLVTAEQNITSKISLNVCQNDSDCIHGKCLFNLGTNSSSCQCSRGWTFSTTSNQCTYEQKSKLAAFLLSFFVGGLGGDWFYLSVGNGGYIAAGVFKMLTLGGIGIWWLVDWIRILTNSFLDGQGVALLEWSP